MPGSVRSEFVTTDPDVAAEMMSAAYADATMRFRGSTPDVRLSHVRHDLGPVRVDAVEQSMTTDYRATTVGSLQVVRVLDSTTTYETGGAVRHFGPGDVFLASQPDEPLAARNHGARLQTVGLDLPLLDEVVGEESGAAVRRFRAGALPVAQAELWQRTVTHTTDTLARPEAQAPLVLDGVRRLLVGAAVSAFDPSVALEGPRDRADATPPAVRRAAAFLEANPHREVGVVDAARAARVSVRTLQVAFRRHLGTTPSAYLRRVRMDRVHADLAAADPATTTVTTVTARWGFPAVGRFSADYLRAYGEHPRDTLRRR